MELELRMGELLELMETSATGGRLRADRKVRIETDSRTLTKGAVFWVLKGENFDGHAFVEGAFEKGVIAAVVDKSWATPTGPSWPWPGATPGASASPAWPWPAPTARPRPRR